VLGIAIFAITGMQLMSTLDGTIVIVALPPCTSVLGSGRWRARARC
jgi:hypothetical protein